MGYVCRKIRGLTMSAPPDRSSQHQQPTRQAITEIRKRAYFWVKLGAGSSEIGSCRFIEYLWRLPEFGPIVLIWEGKYRLWKLKQSIWCFYCAKSYAENTTWQSYYYGKSPKSMQNRTIFQNFAGPFFVEGWKVAFSRNSSASDDGNRLINGRSKVNESQINSLAEC